MLFVFKTRMMMQILSPGLVELEYRASQANRKSHISAAVKVLETRIATAYRLVSAGNHQSAAADLPTRIR